MADVSSRLDPALLEYLTNPTAASGWRHRWWIECLPMERALHADCGTIRAIAAGTTAQVRQERARGPRPYARADLGQRHASRTW